MLRFIISLLIFTALVVITLLLSVTVLVKTVVLALLIFVYIIILVWASANIRSLWFLKTFNYCREQKNKVAITFDDGPDSKNTPLIIDLLNKYNTKASFFVIGSKAVENKEIIKKLANNSHLIGNHSYSHTAGFPLKSSKKIKNEIIQTNNIIREITGKAPKYFRPPFGVTNPNVAKAVKNLGLVVTGWSIRSFDTKNRKPEVVVKRIIKNIRGGDIILLHDTSNNIIQILENLLDYLKKNNIKSVTVEEMHLGLKKNLK